MKRKLLATVGMITLTTASTLAGGLLTNTNQNVAFLRNPSRDAAIGIDGVYSNPAGVGLLSNGLYVSLNWQNAHQTRTINSTFSAFKFGVDNNGQSTKEFEGKADAPFIPSVQLAYNRNNWSFQFNFAITGGGGKAEFDNGLGSFESVVSLIPMLATNYGLNVTRYDFASYLKGRQYYFGGQLGAARVFDDVFGEGSKLSGYAGIRVLYGTCNYYGYVRDIEVEIDGNQVNASKYFSKLSVEALEGAGKYKEGAEQAALAAEQYAAAGMAAEANAYKEKAAEYAAQAAYYQGVGMKTYALASATQDITLNCDQTGVGIAPVIGLDYKIGKWNFAVKYDFKVKMRLENEAANSESANNLEALAKFKDGNSVEEDAPALLAAGVMFEPIEKLRLTAGYHLFFDKQAKQYGDKQKLLDGNTFEYMFGAEYDINKRLQVSAGYQSTNYQFTDAYMSDISFNVSSYTLGGGFGITLTDNIKLNIAYFQTNYGDYNKTTNNYNDLGSMISKIAGAETGNALVASGMLAGKDSFTRTNRVFGLGVDITIPSKK